MHLKRRYIVILTQQIFFQAIEIYSPPNVLIGTIEQEWTLCIPKFVVKNEAGEIVLKIKGPCWTCACFSDVEFKILSAANEDIEVGRISKKWSGLLKEVFTDAGKFEIYFCHCCNFVVFHEN